MKKTNLLKLFLVMLKIGLFTFGGGYAMIAMFENEVVSKRGWIDKDEFLDIVAIAESTPGPIAINGATYIGYRMAGVPGSIVSTLGVVIPSFTIVFVISLFFDWFLTFEYVTYAFRGIQACVIYLILNAGIKMLKQLKKSAFNYIIFGAVATCMILFALFSISFSSVFYILICGTVGLVVFLITYIRQKNGKGKEDAE